MIGLSLLWFHTPGGFPGVLFLPGNLLPHAGIISSVPDQGAGINMEFSEPTFSETDHFFMKRALQLARLALGRTSPNPMVGCVLVRDGLIVGEGYHHKAGTPHAEVHALLSAGELARGATAYVTLEPCSHYGRTPPCAEALIRAGIQRAVVAMVDPNPLVSGRGIRLLREAGLEVEVGLQEDEARALNEVFIRAITTGLPFVVYKSAMTLDGKIATAQGDSQWVSFEASRALVQTYRNQFDVILVGSGTVRADNPSLTCRLPGGRDPIRVIVDGTLSLSENARVLSSSLTAPCIIATTQAADPDKVERLKQRLGVEIWQYPEARHVPLRQVLHALLERGWTGVLLEGGGELAGQMLQEKLIQKVEFFIAPKLSGEGPSPLTGFSLEKMASAIPLEKLKVSLETGDIHVTGYIKPE